MFENKPPSQDAAASLQAVSWADLSARLSAARDLRNALGEDEHGEGSFDAASARWIADHTHDHTEADYLAEKPGVNPDRLGNLKPAGGMADAERARPVPRTRLGDRGK
jgi:hypothetical protein